MKNRKSPTNNLFVLISLSIILTILPSSVISAADNHEFFPPDDYIKSKLQRNDIVCLGTRHKQPKILNFLADLIPSLKDLNDSV